MKHVSFFKLGVTVFFIILALAGVITFSSYRGETASDLVGEVSIWGTFDQATFDQFLRPIQDADQALGKVTYTQIPTSTFNQDVLEAMAAGRSPDLLFIPDHYLHNYLDKVYTLTPDNYSKSTFINNFVDGSEIYFQNGGIVGLPMVSDPLVMFWNRDLFSSAGIARPPTSWTEFFELSQQLSVVDESLNIRQAAIAFGESRNVDYYRNIISTLLLQIGNPIIEGDGNGNFLAVLPGDDDTESAHAALRFYTEFSDASKTVYSWNRSMPDSEDAFLASKLAVHFAPSSRIAPIRQKNPNLNFAVAEIPTVDTSISNRKAVYAPVYGFVIPRVSDNIGGAFRTAVALTESGPMRSFAVATNMAPVRRDLIAESSQESYQDVIKKESLYSRTFIDPDFDETNRILSDLVEFITSGQRSIDNSIYVSNSELDDLLR